MGSVSRQDNVVLPNRTHLIRPTEIVQKEGIGRGHARGRHQRNGVRLSKQGDYGCTRLPFASRVARRPPLPGRSARGVRLRALARRHASVLRAKWSKPYPGYIPRVGTAQSTAQSEGVRLSQVTLRADKKVVVKWLETLPRVLRIALCGRSCASGGIFSEALSSQSSSACSQKLEHLNRNSAACPTDVPDQRHRFSEATAPETTHTCKGARARFALATREPLWPHGSRTERCVSKVGKALGGTRWMERLELEGSAGSIHASARWATAHARGAEGLTAAVGISAD
eukprot:scaffold92101_cov36-Tisochrysis_lutea.AAC.1